jgi:riboflavin kinase / FMN adenylyltransferase
MRGGRLITIGSFDGVHRGHQALLERTVLEARKRKVRTLALTFPIPPRMVLDAHARRLLLSSEFEKRYLLSRHGMEEVEVLVFNRDLAGMRPFGFFKEILFNRLKACGIVIGADFRFGADRSAGALELVRWGEDFGIPVWVIPPVRYARQVVSSTVIRALFEEGRFRKASAFLGHPYLIAGPVIRGHGLGSRIGVPTANIGVHEDKVLPRGVFSVRGWIEGSEHRAGGVMRGVCNIGIRPTFGGKRPTVEVHFPGKKLDLRGRMLCIELDRRLRGEKRFRSIEALKAQINRDIRGAMEGAETGTRMKNRAKPTLYRRKSNVYNSRNPKRGKYR